MTVAYDAAQAVQLVGMLRWEADHGCPLGTVVTREVADQLEAAGREIELWRDGCYLVRDEADVTLKLAHEYQQRRLDVMIERDTLRALLAVVEQDRDAYRAMVCDLLASAHPNQKEHPAMSKQWARARELLKSGPAAIAAVRKTETP